MDIELTKNRILRITQDQDCESPNDWENEDMFLVYKHRQFTVKRDGFNPQQLYNWLQSTEEERIEHFESHVYNNYYIIPVYAYIHGSISLSLGGVGGYKFDTSMSGYILVSKTDFNFDLQRQHTSKLKDANDEFIARYYAEGLIDTWNQYLQGNVYRYDLVHQATCKCCETVKENEEDSCGGFYADCEEDAVDFMLEHVEYERLD